MADWGVCVPAIGVTLKGQFRLEVPLCHPVGNVVPLGAPPPGVLEQATTMTDDSTVASAANLRRAMAFRRDPQRIRAPIRRSATPIQVAARRMMAAMAELPITLARHGRFNSNCRYTSHPFSLRDNVRPG